MKQVSVPRKLPAFAPLALAVFVAAACKFTGCATPDAQPPVREVITESGTPPMGPYSPAIRYGDMLWVAGQIGRDPATGELGTTTGDQVRFAMDNIGVLLERAGFDFDDIVQAQVFLLDLNDYAEMNEAYASYFSGAPPARAAVQVARLPADARVEILVAAAR